MIWSKIGRVEWQGRAGVAELADARDLKSRDPKGRPGSIPGPGTKFPRKTRTDDSHRTRTPSATVKTRLTPATSGPMS